MQCLWKKATPSEAYTPPHLSAAAAQPPSLPRHPTHSNATLTQTSAHPGSCNRQNRPHRASWLQGEGCSCSRGHAYKLPAFKQHHRRWPEGFEHVGEAHPAQSVGHRPSRNWRPAASDWRTPCSCTACGTPGAGRLDHHRLGLFVAASQPAAELDDLLHASHAGISVSASLPWAVLSSRCVISNVLLGDDWAAFWQSGSAMPSCLHSAQRLHHRGPYDARDAVAAQLPSACTAHPFTSDRRLACEQQTKEQVAGNSVHVYHAVACRHPW